MHALHPSNEIGVVITVAASIGMYDAPSAQNPSPIVKDTFETTESSFSALIQIPDIDHFDLVDDPFVVAYRATGGITRMGAFDGAKSYVLRPLEERQAIRDHYILAALDTLLEGASPSERFSGNPFESQGVTSELGGSGR
jgi:hypothetical protein